MQKKLSDFEDKQLMKDIRYSIETRKRWVSMTPYEYYIHSVRAESYLIKLVRH